MAEASKKLFSAAFHKLADGFSLDSTPQRVSRGKCGEKWLDNILIDF